MFNSDSTTIVPRPGESYTAAAFRLLDPNAGRGLTAADETALNAQKSEQLADQAQKLRDCSGHNAQLLIANRAHVATIRQLQDALATATQLIGELQIQLDEATANAASDATADVAWALHVESIR